MLTHFFSYNLSIYTFEFLCIFLNIQKYHLATLINIQRSNQNSHISCTRIYKYMYTLVNLRCDREISCRMRWAALTTTTNRIAVGSRWYSHWIDAPSARTTEIWAARWKKKQKFQSTLINWWSNFVRQLLVALWRVVMIEIVYLVYSRAPHIIIIISRIKRSIWNRFMNYGISCGARKHIRSFF